MRSILDPRLGASLTDFFPSKCTVQNRNRTQESDTGQWVDGTPSDIPGLEDLSCRIGPLILIRPTDNEERIGKVTRVIKTRQLKIKGYFPQIDPTSMLVIVDGTIFNILGNEEDGNQFSTRLRLEVIEPNG